MDQFVVTSEWKKVICYITGNDRVGENCFREVKRPILGDRGQKQKVISEAKNSFEEHRW